MSGLDCRALDGVGLNLQAVFNIDDLPAQVAAEVRLRFDPECGYRQLILIGHAGKTLWQAVQASGIVSEDPIDDFSVRTVEDWFRTAFPGRRHQVIYPGEHPVGLLSLGRLAGWHHPSPFMIGIQEKWGTWYAYRVAMLTDTGLEPSRPLAGKSPCDTCVDRICVASCPAGALVGQEFELEKCIAYRKKASSSCRLSCLARTGCQVGAEHRYCDEQIHHTYSRSLKAIEDYY